MKQLRQYRIVGYLEQRGTEYGFMTPVYESKNRYFVHELSWNDAFIVSFCPYVFARGQQLVPILDGPIKRLGDPVHIIFKNGAKIIAGTANSKDFLQQLEDAHRDLPPKFQAVSEAIKELLF